MVAIPYADQSELVEVGYLIKNGHTLSLLGGECLRLLSRHIEMLQLPVGE